MKKLLIYSPCVILIVVALSQIYITHSDRLLTPAKGGGFGMFATVDKLNNRVVNVYGVFGDNKVPITIDKKKPHFKELIKESWQTARAYPTYDHMKSLAEALGTVRLSREPEFLRIEVKKCVFDPDSTKVRFDLVNEFSISYNRIKNKGS